MWEKYQKLLAEGKSINDAMNELGLTRFCCRRMIMTHVEIIDKLLLYSGTTSAKHSIPFAASTSAN
jgi:DNA-directed RNA polymerase I, II, and III subunit RPABC5